MELATHGGNSLVRSRDVCVMQYSSLLCFLLLAVLLFTVRDSKLQP
jgi:hypothetical protein